MSEHYGEYRELLAKADQRDRDAIRAHWELGVLFARYGEAVTDIAQAIGRSVTYVADHIRIARAVPTAEALDRVLEGRDDIQTWTVLIDWVKAGGPGQESDEEPDAPEISRHRRQGAVPGGSQLAVPSHVVRAIADSGHDPREVLLACGRHLHAVCRALYEAESPREPVLTVESLATRKRSDRPEGSAS